MCVQKRQNRRPHNKVCTGPSVSMVHILTIVQTLLPEWNANETNEHPNPSRATLLHEVRQMEKLADQTIKKNSVWMMS